MDNKQVTLTIDGTPVTVAADATIMEAAEQLGIYVPRLCYHPKLSLAGSCRVCIVEVEGVPFYMASCSVKVADGMVVRTNSPEIRQARRDIVELLLDNHPQDCQDVRARRQLRTAESRLFDGNSSPSFRRRTQGVRNGRFRKVGRPECRRSASSAAGAFRVCSEIQGVHNLSQHGRGFHTVVGPAHLEEMADSVCIRCGQCINVCPTAAFIEQSSTDAVWNALADPDMHVVIQTAPSIRAAIGEGFNLPPGTPVVGEMVTALRRLGFDAVFDTNFGADLTIVEEGE